LKIRKTKLKNPVYSYGFIVKESHCFFIIDSSGNTVLIHNGFWGDLWDSIKKPLAIGFAAGFSQGFDRASREREYYRNVYRREMYRQRQRMYIPISYYDSSLSSSSSSSSYDRYNRNYSYRSTNVPRSSRNRYVSTNTSRPVTTSSTNTSRPVTTSSTNTSGSMTRFSTEEAAEEDQPEEESLDDYDTRSRKIPVITRETLILAQSLSSKERRERSRGLFRCPPMGTVCSMNPSIELGVKTLSKIPVVGPAVAAGTILYGAYKHLKGGFLDKDRRSRNHREGSFYKEFDTPEKRLSLGIDGRISRMKKDNFYSGYSDSAIVAMAKSDHAIDLQLANSNIGCNRINSYRNKIAKALKLDLDQITISDDQINSGNNGTIVFDTPKGKIFVNKDCDKSKKVSDEYLLSHKTTGSGDKGPEEPEFRENSISHIFDGKKNHFTKTPENMKKVLDIARDNNNYLGDDWYKNRWFARNVNGAQEWCKLRGNKITSAGRNPEIRTFNKETGLCSPKAPGGTVK